MNKYFETTRKAKNK